MIGGIRQFIREAAQLVVIVRGEFHPNLAAFQTGRYAYTDPGMELQLLDLSTQRIFGLGQTRIAQPANLFFDFLEPVSAAQARVCRDIVDRFACENLMNRDLVAQSQFFEPVEQIAQVILADLKRKDQPFQRETVGGIPAKPASNRLRMKSLGLGVFANLRFRHFSPG